MRTIEKFLDKHFWLVLALILGVGVVLMKIEIDRFPAAWEAYRAIGK